MAQSGHRLSTRRDVLTTTLGVTAITLAGCVDRAPPDDPGGDGDPTNESDGGESVVDRSGAWPQFGGDLRNSGTVPDATGPGASDPKLAWRYDAGTPTMNASPVVGDGTVCVPGSGDPGLIHAVDIDSGERVWQFEPEGYASSAPALVDDTLYFGTFEKQFYALDAASGEPRWSEEIGHRFGGSSPAVVDGTVYVGTTGDGPLVVRGPEDEEEFEACALLALGADSGEERWRYDEFGERENITTSPAVGDDHVYFGGADTLYALERDGGGVAWTRDGPAQRVSPVVVDGTVYYGGPSDSRSGPPATVRARDAASGETLWTADIDDTSLRASPAVADGTVYVAASSSRTCVGDECRGTTRGRLYALDAANGDREWTAPIESDTRSAPAVVDGVVYVGCGNGLSAVTTDGESAWRLNFENLSAKRDRIFVDSSPAVANGHAFVGAADGHLRAVTTGES